MYRITKQFTFSAAHMLDYLPITHKCHRLHGHNYTVELVAEGDLDGNDFVVDFDDLSVVGKWITETFDHRFLNEVLPCRSTSENLARHIYHHASAMFPQVVAVRVSETPNTWAEYREE